MNARIAAVLVVLLAVLGGGALLVYQQESAQRPPAAGQLGQPVLPALQAADIATIVIREGQSTLTLQRRNAQHIDIVVTADTTATVQDVARHIVETDPARETIASPRDALTLKVAPPTSSTFTMLSPETLISDAAVGSGFVASIVNLGEDYVSTRTNGGPPAAVLSIAAGPLANEAVKRLFERIIDETRSLERHLYERESGSDDEPTQG